MKSRATTHTTDDLVALGLAVCEVAAPREDGTCSCRMRADCPSPGKHPVGRGWLKSALKARERGYRRLPVHARLAPQTSYGLIPMPGSGVIVIDRDDPSVGLPMADTFEVHRESADPRKGHYYFRLADGIAEDEVPRTFAGGEVRVGGSGHIVGPGCRHASGDLYEGNGSEVGEADRALIDYLLEHPAVRRSAEGAVEAVVGSRHQWLTQQARKLGGWGRDADEIEEELRALNEEYCHPPLDERAAEFDRMAAWAEANIAPDTAVTINRRRTSRRRDRADRPEWAR